MPNKVYYNPETGITWKSSGGTHVFTGTSVANGAGRLGDRGDLGAQPNAALYRWFAETKIGAGLTVGSLVRVYLAWWNDEATPGDSDGAVGASDAAFATENNLRNLKHIGNIVVRSTTTTDIHTGSGLVMIPVRYVSPVWWNASGGALSATATDHEFHLTAVPPEIQ